MTQQLIKKIQKMEAPIYVGLDPMFGYISEYIVKGSFHEFEEILEGAAGAAQQSNKEVVDHTFDSIPSARPQITTYEQLGLEGLVAYQRMMKYCQEKGLVVIGNIKREDIGSTSTAYATGHIGHVQVGNGSFTSFGTEFITTNSYFGTNGTKPFVDICSKEDKGLFVLMRTSNPSSGEFQNKLIGGRPLYKLVAEKVVERGDMSMGGAYSNVGAVARATYPEISHALRKLMSNTYFLVPGHGAQGGAAEDSKYCFNEDGLRVIMSSSRNIVAAYKQEKYARFGVEHFAEMSRRAAMDMAADINSML